MKVLVFYFILKHINTCIYIILYIYYTVIYDIYTCELGSAVVVVETLSETKTVYL